MVLILSTKAEHDGTRMIRTSVLISLSVPRISYDTESVTELENNGCSLVRRMADVCARSKYPIREFDNFDVQILDYISAQHKGLDHL